MFYLFIDFLLLFAQIFEIHIFDIVYMSAPPQQQVNKVNHFFFISQRVCDTCEPSSCAFSDISTYVWNYSENNFFFLTFLYCTISNIINIIKVMFSGMVL